MPRTFDPLTETEREAKLARARPQRLPMAPRAMPARRKLPLMGEAREADRAWKPVYAVWEITLRCDFVKEVTIIGGEAYLRDDWTDTLRAIRERGMSATMTTGGRGITEDRARAPSAAGLESASISIDGLEATHDRLRCTWTSFVLFGKAGNNPYCHHRALEMQKAGKRERIVQVGLPPGTPFDYGRFDLVVEDEPRAGRPTDDPA